jgi:hypothetical protein
VALSRRASPRLAQREAAARSDGLGHYVASLMLAGGADISTVCKLLGHASISITADVCAHVLAAVGQRPAEGAAVLIAYTVHTQQAVKADASQGSWWPKGLRQAGTLVGLARFELATP